STLWAIRVCICPASATGRSGVMLTVAPPTCSSADRHSASATNIERPVTVQNAHDGVISLAVGIPWGPPRGCRPDGRIRSRSLRRGRPRHHLVPDDPGHEHRALCPRAPSPERGVSGTMGETGGDDEGWFLPRGEVLMAITYEDAVAKV